MTVSELIEELSKLEDQNARVVVRGYEGGVNDLRSDFDYIKIALDINLDTWYYGDHEVVDIHEEDDEDHEDYLNAKIASAYKIG